MSYRTVDERFWRDPKVQDLDLKSKLVFLYFITSANAHYSGIYYCPISLICEETGLDENEARYSIDTLSKGYMIAYSYPTKEVFVANMAKFQVKGAKQIAGVARHFESSVQSQALIKKWMDKHDTLSIPYPYPIVYPTDTTETETETETERETGKEKTSKKKTATEIEKPKPKPKRRKKRQAEKPEDVSEQVWEDFLTLREKKRAPLTDTALRDIEREAKKAGISLQDALIHSAAKGWQGFEASWYAKNRGTSPENNRRKPYTQLAADDRYWEDNKDELEEIQRKMGEI